ncbi:Crp/Fnr family transcriptional regulator [Maribellus maritimus]|uniref:Crp/Fnr family transcriptional regulator n=1 Tax=Maribellus maritimus TaxID=2870838 RepID=UPI001EE9B24A|nr:Crp/Fnr family transcriptional regulator [Maribellus maritimus]MCG6187551.1 Crp/Fnr family transcriptional regulator [Maribellus maritimus]
MNLVEKIKKFYKLTEKELEASAHAFKPAAIPAKTYFMEEGKVANHVGFIERGLFRSFFYDDNANDITTHFFQPGTVLISMKSFNDQVPARENIVALEDSEIYVINHEEMMELYKRVPAWRQITKDVDEMKYNDLMNRSIQLQTLTAKERYELFCQNYPEIIKRVALRHIASYLGIDIATLSRIRKKL